MNDYQFDYKEYKKKIKNKGGMSFLIILFIIILLVGVIYFIIPKASDVDYLYFVQTNQFLNYNDASIKAAEIQQQNGAGFIYYDSVYHVLAGFYPDEKSAISVVNNIKATQPDSMVFKLECNKFIRHKNLTNNQNELIFEIINKNVANLNKIYENIIKFDKNEVNINELNINFLNLKTDYDNLIANFNKNFDKKSKYLHAVACLKKIKSSVNNLCLHLANNEFYKLKYETISIAVQHQSFLSCF